jgi:hypothetical protein
MNNELTPAALEELKKKGFKYVIVSGYAHDNRPDYMEAHYFVLEPVKQLPEDVNKKGIYEPIESPLLMEWAKHPHEGTRILIKMGQNP